MKTSFANLKLWARRALLGKYGTTTGACLILFGILMGIAVVMEVFLIIGVVSSVESDGFRVSAVMMVMILIMCFVIFMFEFMMIPGILRLYLNICKGDEYRVSDIFFAFKNHAGKFMGIMLLLSLGTILLATPNLVLSFAMGYTGKYDMTAFYVVFICLYSCLYMALFLYVGLTYGQFYLILVEDSEKGILEALRESKELMVGNRGRLFLLGLSFIGWILLAYCTFGWGFIWLFPYMGCTYIQFYLDLKPKFEEISPEWQQF